MRDLITINKLRQNALRMFILVSAVFLSACGGGDDASPANGQITVKVTDGPVDMAENVYVQFSALELHGANGTQTISFDPAKKIDLMTLTEGNTADFINDLQIPAGQYQWMRLTVDTDEAMDTYIVVNGSPHELTIPSGEQNGLKLISGFSVPEGNHAVYVVDFDLRKSVTEDNNGYKLRPTLRLLNESQVGVISGTVDLAALQCQEMGAAVYVFAGLQQTPDDIGSAGANPVTSAKVKFNDTTSDYRYTAAFVHHGDYTVALTCMADMDDPMEDDAIQFIDPQDAVVTKGVTTTVNFPQI